MLKVFIYNMYRMIFHGNNPPPPHPPCFGTQQYRGFNRGWLSLYSRTLS